MKKLFCVLLALLLLLTASCAQNSEADPDAPYDAVRSDFRTMLSAMQNGQFEAYIGGEKTYTFHFLAESEPMKHWWDLLSYLYAGNMAEDEFTYAAQDLDQNGTDECVLLHPADSDAVMAVFTFEGDHARLIDAFGGHYRARVKDDGTILTFTGGGAYYMEYRENVLRENALVCRESAVCERGENGETRFYSGLTNEAVTREAFVLLEDKWNEAGGVHPWAILLKETPDTALLLAFSGFDGVFSTDVSALEIGGVSIEELGRQGAFDNGSCTMPDVTLDLFRQKSTVSFGTSDRPVARTDVFFSEANAEFFVTLAFSEPLAEEALIGFYGSVTAEPFVFDDVSLTNRALRLKSGETAYTVSFDDEEDATCAWIGAYQTADGTICALIRHTFDYGGDTYSICLCRTDGTVARFVAAVRGEA